MTRRHLAGAATLAPLLLLAAAASAGAQATATPAAAPPRAAARFDLSVANIMRGEALVGRSPSDVRWSDDGRWVWFRWRRPESRDTLTSMWRVAASGGAPEMVPDSVADRTAPAAGGRWSRDRSRRAFERGGDVFVWDAAGGERRVTDTPVRERGVHLSPDGRTVYFLQGGNLFAMDLSGGPLRQVTDLRSADAPKKDEPRGQRRVLEEQQTELFDVVRGRRAERERRERLDSLRTRVRPVYLGKTTTVASAEVSPSGRYVLLAVNDEVAGEKQTMVPNFVTESGYTEPLNVRSKVGDVQQGQRVAVLEPATGRLAWVEPEARERGVTYAALEWSPSEDRALVTGIPADFKDRWLYAVGPDGRALTLDHLRDTAWVGGPVFASAGWMPDGQRAWFISERTGYAHLYTVPARGGTATAVTAGTWEVTGVQLSPDGRTFYLTTGETHPGERGLYAVAASGGGRRRIDGMDGWNDGTVSPDGRMAFVLHSTASTPAELYLVPVSGGTARQVTESRTPEFRSGPWIRPEVVTFRARDGGMVHARIYRPRDLGAAPNGGAVLFVHGAGYLQNAHRGWSVYFREYMFNHLLASRGYTVLDVDYRGSAGYGAAWRTGIHRHMGGKDLTDHVDAARWLVANEGVDPKRVGLYGGSYGGFITLMGMFTEPETFRSGAALRSVTDWAHYNHWYTNRILGQPQTDTLAYRRSSPIYFAEGLRGDLLIAHGMVDTNVHFQDVVRLAQRLIELGKTHWEMAVYPVEDHAFVRADSWTDEYRRILELFERTLRPGAPAAGTAAASTASAAP